MNIGLGIGIPFTRSSLWASIFTPSALFLDGSTQGVWYDPSDINLTWRRNLLTYSEQFDNTVWTKSSCTITPNATTAPDGTLTADRAVFTSGGLLYVNSVPASAGTYVFSGYVKSATGSTQTMQIFGNGTLTYSGDLPVTADWTRVSFKFTYSAVTSGFATSSGQALDIYIWGAQLEQGSTATPYQRITDGIQDYLQYQPLPVMYRDAAGTLPVTAVEQPVGLMLDKSKGLVLGPELVMNGGFDTDVSGWTRDISWVASGIARVTTSTISGPYQTLTTVVGRRYNVTARLLTSTTQARVRINTDNGLLTTVAETADVSSGVLTLSFVATSTTSTVYLRNAAAGITDWDNISVRELPGNHAFNPSGNSANFPVLSARYNLLTKTEDFSDAVWSKNKTSVTANSLTAPNGTLTADTVTADGTSGIHSVTTLSGSSSVGSNKVLAVYAKAGTNNFIQLRVDFLANAYANFDLSSGVKGTTGAELASASIESAGNGWYRCSIVTNSSSDVAGIFNVVLVSSATSGNNESNTLSTSVYLWGADLRATNDALNQPAYQRVNTATDYDTVGFKPYVRFNGVNQWLQTNSIDFSYSDKMFVSAGVRKLSDAIGFIFEFSANADSQIGSFVVVAASATYTVQSRGTNVGYYTPGTYAAPITNVVSGVFDIAGSALATEVIPRVNGVVNQSNGAGGCGTGNYGNYPLYIGARAGTSLFFNGRLYQLVIAAGSEIRITEEDSDLFLSESGDFITAETTVAVIQSAIEQTEAFVNRKTSAF